MSTIQQLVDQYNQAEAQQSELVRQIFAELVAAGPGHKAVHFSNGQALADHNLSEPKVANPFLAALANPITLVEGGE